jgi:hypothetical protein
MPFDLIAAIAGFFLAVIDLLRLSLIVAIPAFLIVLAAQRLNAFIKKRLKLSWIATAFLATFAAMLPITFIAYLAPFLVGYSSSPFAGMPVPDFLQLTAIDYTMAVISTIIKNIITAFVLSVLLLPLIFLATYLDEKLGQKLKVPKLANTFLAIFITAAISWIIVLFIFPWIYTGLFELLWWGGI